MTANDSLTSILKKHLRGTPWDHDQNVHAGGHAAQATPAPASVSAPASSPAPAVKPKDREYDLPKPLKEKAAPPPPPAFNPAAAALPTFTGKLGPGGKKSKAQEAFEALAEYQKELNDAIVNNRVPIFSISVNTRTTQRGRWAT